METITETKDGDITITNSAAERIAALIAAQNDDGQHFRVRVDGGGCNGFQYIFDLDNTVQDDDLRFEKNGITVLIDEMSLNFLKGSALDYVEDLMGSYFTVKNPNASSSCGCGTSFSV